MAGTLGTDTRGNTVTKTDEQKKILALQLGAMQKVASPTGGGSNPVSGIREVDAFTNYTGNHSVAAGAISIGFIPSSDFAGTVQGLTYAGSQGPISRTAQPGNTLPAFAVTVSAGNFSLYVVTPT